MRKVVADPEAAVEGVQDGSSVACGGFGLAGTPIRLMAALAKTSVSGLEIISNNGGVDDWTMGPLLEQGRVRKIVATHIGGNRKLQARFMTGDIEIEFVPQGTFAERLRAGGAGIAGFFTPTGVGTLVETGGLPTRHDLEGRVIASSSAKEVRRFGDECYVLEHALRPDVALVHAHLGDSAGNLIYRYSARNFNPVMAMAARFTVAEVERLVDVGEIGPDEVHTPGVFVDRLVEVGEDDKRITSPPSVPGDGSGKRRQANNGSHS